MGRTTCRISRGAARAALCAACIAALGQRAPEALTPVFAQTRASSDTVSSTKQRVLLYERSFRPSTYDAPLLPPAPDSLPPGTAMISGTAAAAPETVQGFRIQVMNTNSYDESASMRTALMEQFDTWWVYVLYDAPTYKVRVGDFATRLEAKSALEQIQLKGFTNAWLVPDRVVLHLPPRMPLAAPIDSTLMK